MNFKNKLLHLFLFSLFIIPNIVFAYSNKVILGGDSIGIEVKSKNVVVVGFYKVGEKYPAMDAGFKVGDKIVEVNGKKIEEITDLTNSIKENNNEIKIERGKSEKIISFDLVKERKEKKSSVYKTGLYVKNKISGIGTLTYIDPNTKVYGALGHEITDSTTKEKVEIQDGKIFYSNITGITKSSGGQPGEKNATLNGNDIFGDIKNNKISGIFGRYTKEYDESNLIQIGKKNEIHEGKAYIKTVVEKDKIEEFEINITKINTEKEIKNILFEVTDKRLLGKTNGIVSGMSGSPIIQDEKLVAAVTHVVVSNPIKGYGIFITTMLEEGDKAN